MGHRLLILGVGNILMKDDGIGVYTAHELKKSRLPRGVKVLDAGTMGPGLIDLMREAAKVIFLDAVEMGKKPGTVARLTAEELGPEDDDASYSLHEIKLPQVLQLACLLGISTEVVIFGMQPKEIGFGNALSPPLKKAIPHMVESVLKEIYNVLDS